MAKERECVPAKTRDQILREFNHRCAKCGTDRPHLHHIDEDPSHNDQMNLIPLCPNCHLTDQHNPTQSIEPDRLRQFRQYKDPTILTPEFHVVFRRMRFLSRIAIDSDAHRVVYQTAVAGADPAGHARSVFSRSAVA